MKEEQELPNVYVSTEAGAFQSDSFMPTCGNPTTATWRCAPLRAVTFLVGEVDVVVCFVLRDELKYVLHRCLVADHQDTAVAVELYLRSVEMTLLRERTNLVHKLF